MAVSYAVDVGSYDVYSLLFTRLGDNLTYSCSGYGASCETNGHGLVATVRTGRRRPGRPLDHRLLDRHDDAAATRRSVQVRRATRELAPASPKSHCSSRE